MRGGWKAVPIVSVATVICVLCTMAYAQGPELAGPTRGTALHLAYSPRVRSAGMGGASVAIEGTDSFNPAALGWLKEGEVELSFNDYDFRNGPHAYAWRTDVSYPLLGGGLQLKGFFLDSDRSVSKMGGAEADVWGREFGFAYGRHINDYISMGMAGFPSDISELRLHAPGGDEVAEGRGESKLGSARLGALVRLPGNKEWRKETRVGTRAFTLEMPTIRLGATFDHIIDRLKGRYHGAFPDAHDTYYANVWTIGGAIDLTETTMFVADYKWGTVHGENVRAHPRSPNFGLEKRPKITIGDVKYDGLALRVGSTRGNLTAGAGAKFLKRWEVNYAYVDGAGEDVRKAFGEATMHAVSVRTTF